MYHFNLSKLMNEVEQLRETIKKIECHIKTAKEKLSELEAEMKEASEGVSEEVRKITEMLRASYSKALTCYEKLLEEAQAELSALEE